MRRLIPVLAFIIITFGLMANNIYPSENLFSEIKPRNEIPFWITDVKEEGLAPYRYINALVVKAVDGDTIKIDYKDNKYSVRLLCIDTPESITQGVPTQSYAREASAFTKKLTLNQLVKLVFEKDVRDKYGRLLAHIILKNGDYLNALLVTNGFARVEIVSPNNSCSSYFYELQDGAIRSSQGLWSLPRNKQPFVLNNNGVYVPVYWDVESAS